LNSSKHFVCESSCTKIPGIFSCVREHPTLSFLATCSSLCSALCFSCCSWAFTKPDITTLARSLPNATCNQRILRYIKDCINLKQVTYENDMGIWRDIQSLPKPHPHDINAFIPAKDAYGVNCSHSSWIEVSVAFTGFKI